jgi:hypothetical protein
MTTKIIFNDGSSIEWVDKETIKYIEGKFSLLIWVDFAPGFFSNERIIKTNSMKSWNTTPESGNKLIDDKKRQNIIEKIHQYYKSFNKNIRIE